jgi:hypothetical protein
VGCCRSFDALRRTDPSVGSEALDVLVRPGREDEADGWNEAGRDPAAAEDDVDEGATGASVSVGERMDGLELRVRDRRLDQRRMIVAVDILDEIAQQGFDVVRRRRDEARRVFHPLPRSTSGRFVERSAPTWICAYGAKAPIRTFGA